jgi:hypothetical protein
VELLVLGDEDLAHATCPEPAHDAVVEEGGSDHVFPATGELIIADVDSKDCRLLFGVLGGALWGNPSSRRSTLTKLTPAPRIAAMTDDVSRLLARELSAFVREVELFPDDERLFRTLPGVTNSAGNLALHVSGNLKHFLGAVLGGTGYVRDREAEFGARSGRREDAVRELRETATVVADTLGRLPLENDR